MFSQSVHEREPMPKDDPAPQHSGIYAKLVSIAETVSNAADLVHPYDPSAAELSLARYKVGRAIMALNHAEHQLTLAIASCGPDEGPVVQPDDDFVVELRCNGDIHVNLTVAKKGS